MTRKLLSTDDDRATALLRLVLGAVFFAHGAPKMLPNPPNMVARD
jgi:uncharacterized membrane protein YphA (DoxX/SURF4 family)